MRGIGLKRLQHLVRWVSDVDLLRDPRLRGEDAVPERGLPAHRGEHGGSPPDFFEQPGVTGPDEGALRMYHSAWEVGELTDLVRARRRLIEARSLMGSSDHGVSLSLYAKDPDGLEFEVFWTVPGGRPVGTRALHLEGELARRGIPMPEEIDGAPST